MVASRVMGDRGLWEYLRHVQSSTLTGTHALSRGWSVRSVYRWHRSLGERLLVVPNIAVEALGLCHAHVFIAAPTPSDLDCDFAVEAAVVTPDLCGEVLYVHCVVPSSLRGVWRPNDRSLVVWSGSGWQQFFTADEPVMLPVDGDVPVGDIARRVPLVIPALYESWSYPNSLPALWSRIRERLGERARSFVRRRVRVVNGKSHVRDAFHALRGEGLVRQHIVRYHPLLSRSVEVFMVISAERSIVS